jgi:hypothetical protein
MPFGRREVMMVAVTLVTRTGTIMSRNQMALLILAAASAAIVLLVRSRSTGSAERIWEVRFAVPASEPVFGSGGAVYTGAAGEVVCLNARNGKILWRKHLGEWLSASPVTSGSVVYAGVQQGGEPTHVVALAADTGNEAWRADIPTRLLLSGDNGLLFAFDQDIVAVSAATGKVRWRVKSTFDAATTPFASGADQSRVEDAILHAGTLYVTTDCPGKTLRAFEASTGRPKWSNPLNPTVQFGCQMPSSLAMDKEGRKVVTSVGDRLIAFDARTGAKMWESEPGLFLADPAFGPDGAVYAATWEGLVRAVDGRTGATLWSRHVADRAPGGLLSHGGMLLVGGTPNTLYALDPKSGAVRHRAAVGHSVLGPLMGYPDWLRICRDSHGSLYATTSDGRLLALRSTPR